MVEQDGGDEELDASLRTIHPAVVGRERALAGLADAVRRLTAVTVTTAAGPAELDAATATLEAVAGRLAGAVPAAPFPRFAEPGPLPPGEARTMGASMPFDVVIGRYNPLALPVAIRFEPPLAIGTGTFTTPYEGAPGCVHGAALAGTFDIVLTAANHLAGAAGPTVRLALRFRRPTLIGVESRFEAEVTAVETARIHSRGRLVQDGLVTVEAEGEFAVLSHERIRQLAERRRPQRT